MAIPVGPLLICWLFCLSALALPQILQSPLALLSPVEESSIPPNELKSSDPLRIAIIGSGITGAAAAYNVYERFRTKQTAQPEITVFERNTIIGGRFTQAYALDDPRYPVDTCAATFSTTDSCIVSSATNVGLMVSTANVPVNAGTGVWNGTHFVGFVEADGFRNPIGWSFFRRMKWFQRYGEAPTRLNGKVTTARQKFLPLLVPQQPMVPAEPTRNLKQEVVTVGLEPILKDTLCTLEDQEARIDCEKGKEGLFVEEVFNAGARERYFGNIDELNGLESLLGYEAGLQSSVIGGNLRLIDRLLTLSRATLRLGTTVRALEKDEDTSKWLIDSVNKPKGPGRPGILSRDEFDIVILASSLDLANLTFMSEFNTDRPGLQQSYADSYVTHFTTTSFLNGTYFGQEVGMPQNVLTSLALRSEGNDAEPPFFSLTLIRQIGRTTDPQDPNQREGNLYKIVSRSALSDDEIGSYLQKNTDDPTEPLISWIDRQPLPASVPTNDDFDGLLEDIEIAPGLIYAGGGEQVAAVAEFGCRMGVNAAVIVASGV